MNFGQKPGQILISNFSLILTSIKSKYENWIKKLSFNQLSLRAKVKRKRGKYFR